jgi:hypothetical protein
MQIFLIRVGADQSDGGGSWNGPVDSSTGRFVYVPIPEGSSVRPGLEKPYGALAPYLDAFGTALPAHLLRKGMHLDPDLEHVTYGDRGNKGAQLANNLKRGDRLLFYSGLKDIRSQELVYALIGTIVVDRVERATDWPPARYDENAHTRRVLAIDAQDIIVVGQPRESGRLTRCIPIGEYRSRAYRLMPSILKAWGSTSAADGYLQRSAVFPSLKSPEMFQAWWNRQNLELIRTNNTHE